MDEAFLVAQVVACRGTVFFGLKMLWYRCSGTGAKAFVACGVDTCGVDNAFGLDILFPE